MTRRAILYTPIPAPVDLVPIRGQSCFFKSKLGEFPS